MLFHGLVQEKKEKKSMICYHSKFWKIRVENIREYWKTRVLRVENMREIDC